MGRYRTYLTLVPFFRDFDSRMILIKPSFRFRKFKGTPCVTEWLYDWILHLGYLSIHRRSDHELSRSRSAPNNAKRGR